MRSFPLVPRFVLPIIAALALAPVATAWASDAFERGGQLDVSKPRPIVAQAQRPAATSGGALLYDTHCVACHTTQIHWRDAKLATNWTALVAQVRRWQANLGLQWSDEEIDDVASYLNRTIYKLPDAPGKRVG
jgi:mono/diheme cytochrome c family protein